jgi:hypothetical protein
MTEKVGGEHSSIGARVRRWGNTAWYHWRRSRWLLDPRRFVRRYNEVTIDRPVFFVGNQGGGLTLVVRMLRRHPHLVSIVGDHRHWSGPDEMQRVMELRLPKSLKLARVPYNVEVQHARLTAPRSWSYATDELLPAYRKTEEDYDKAEAEAFRFLIREALHKQGHGSGSRFVDKSQVYTVKLRLLQRILADADPYFVLVTRNPYAACYRAAQGKAIDMKRYAATMSLEERIELCAQHWDNAMRCALNDAPSLRRFKVIAFERVLSEPMPAIRDLCDFLGLVYDDDLLPQPHHEIPFGTRFLDRWYPLKPEVNDAYLRRAEAEHLRIIERRCGETAERLGYASPLG